jgi:hypothetical protein
MKNNVRTVLGVCFALWGAAASAVDGGEPPATSAEAGSGGAEQRSRTEAGEVSGTSGSGARPASTGTAVGVLYEGVKKGKIKIEGEADPGAPGL